MSLQVHPVSGLGGEERAPAHRHRATGVALSPEQAAQRLARNRRRLHRNASPQSDEGQAVLRCRLRPVVLVDDDLRHLRRRRLAQIGIPEEDPQVGRPQLRGAIGLREHPVGFHQHPAALLGPAAAAGEALVGATAGIETLRRLQLQRELQRVLLVALVAALRMARARNETGEASCAGNAKRVHHPIEQSHGSPTQRATSDARKCPRIVRPRGGGT